MTEQWAIDAMKTKYLPGCNDKRTTSSSKDITTPVYSTPFEPESQKLHPLLGPLAQD